MKTDDHPAQNDRPCLLPSFAFNNHSIENRKALLPSFRRGSGIEKGEANISVIPFVRRYRKKTNHTLSPSKSEPCFSELGLLKEEEDEDKQEEIEDNPGTLASRQAFLRRSHDLLIRPLDVFSVRATPPSKTELLEALRTSLSRGTRLSEYRRSQSARIILLQQQLDGLNSEMDASVDALRHQQCKTESERRRWTLQARDLRQQLAQALALLQKSGKNGLQQSPQNDDSKARVDCGCLNCDRCSFEILTLRVTVEKLESDLERQRTIASKEEARLRGQLAESSSDARSLRLKIARNFSNPLSSAPQEQQTAPVGSASPCASCQRLQHLLDLVQEKRDRQITTINCPEKRDTQVQTELEPTADNAPLSSLFTLFESRISLPPPTLPPPCINDLATEYLEQQLGSSLEVHRSATNNTSTQQPPPGLPPPASEPLEGVSHEDSVVTRLQYRLRHLEYEVESSADQLRASNSEFLELRERLTSATVEKAHLKATVDGLVDQVTRLETALFQSMQELRRAREPRLKMSPANHPLDCIIQLTNHDGHPKPTHQLYFNEPKTQIIRDKLTTVYEKLLPYANVFRSTLVHASIAGKGYLCFLERLCNLTGVFALSLGTRLAGPRPRMVLFLGMLIYLTFLHVMLFNCWL